MAKVILGYVVMVAVILGLSVISGVALTFLVGNTASTATYWVFNLINAFIAYWVSIRFVVQPRTAAPASLNNSTKSECKS